MKARIGTKSITSAMQARDALRRVGIPAEIIRLRPNESPNGCAYGLEIAYHALAGAQAILQNSGVRFTVL